MAKDYYQVLGVARTATADDIKKAYRKKARASHPDANLNDPTASERFKDISEAYDTLKDPEKREAYDHPPTPFQGQGSGFGPRGSKQGAGFPGGINLDDLFHRAAGSGFARSGFSGPQPPRGPAPQRGADIKVSAPLSFKESFTGTQLKLKVSKPTICTHCHGIGAEPPSRPVRCPQCQGQGQVIRNEGYFAMAELCPRCHGAGEIIDHPCSICHGAGAHLKDFTYRVPVPAGVKDRATLKVKGKGEMGSSGGASGDILVKIQLTNTDGFERRGDDYVVDVPISLADAALGAQVKVRLPEGGTVKVAVPKGSNEGKLLRIKGRGAPRKGSGNRGDLLARVRISVPTKLTPEQEAALRAYQQASPSA